MSSQVTIRPGYSIPRIINGGWQLSAGHRPADGDANLDERDREKVLLRAMGRLADAGLTAFDGADIYTGVEVLYGRFRASRPNGNLQFHTKFVPDLDLLPRITEADVRSGIERSLDRLGVDALDLVQFHWWDFAVDGWLQTGLWLDQLRCEGKIRHLAVTNFDTERLARLIDGGAEISAHQVQYSLLDRRPERSMAALCDRHHVHLLCYGTLAGGFLSDRWLGKPEPSEPLENRSLVKYRLMIEELGGWPVFQELLVLLSGLAEKHGVSVANVATAWTLSRPQVASAIVGFRDDRHLEDNLRTLGLNLRPEDVSAIDEFLTAHPGAQGDIYSVERVPDGRHAVIMKTGLNQASPT